MAVVRVKQFENEFEKEEYEIYALIYREATGGRYYLKKYIQPNAGTYATVDCRNGQLEKKAGRLVWLVSTRSNNYGYDFKRYGIYKLLVRKIKQKELDEYTSKSVNNSYLVLKVLDCNVKHSELSELSKYLQQPKMIHTKLGEFSLNREFGWFSLKLSNYEIILNQDDELSDTCIKALEVYKKYEDCLEDLDQKLRLYAAKNMLTAGNEWLEDAGEELINEEQFMERISITTFIFDNKGEIQAYYDDGDIFWGHCIIVSINADGNVVDCEIAG